MKEIIDKLIKLNKTISTMESCMGGHIANSITNISGSSNVFKYGCVTYANEYKIKMGVNKDTIDKYTVYSMEVAREMSKVISDYTLSDYSVGVTGKFKEPDNFNPYKEDDIVHISIYDRLNDKYYTSSLKVLKEGRINNKEEVLIEVVKLLNDAIK